MIFGRSYNVVVFKLKLYTLWTLGHFFIAIIEPCLKCKVFTFAIKREGVFITFYPSKLKH